jgi:hypothetical protein
VGVLL